MTTCRARSVNRSNTFSLDPPFVEISGKACRLPHSKVAPWYRTPRRLDRAVHSIFTASDRPFPPRALGPRRFDELGREAQALERGERAVLERLHGAFGLVEDHRGLGIREAEQELQRQYLLLGTR